jgi:hypothetical protein
MMGSPNVSTTGDAPLVGRLRQLIDRALVVYAGTAEQEMLRELSSRLDEPLRVAIAGRLKAGKSTLLNAVLGERVAATDATECTRVVTWYIHGVAPRAWAHPRTGEPHQLSYTRADGSTTVQLGDFRVEDLQRLSIEVPNSQLERMSLIDTPGMGSVSVGVSARTVEFISGNGNQGADAVVYLMRQIHATDVDFLEAFQQDEFRGTSPVNAIGVLSRSDELGAGRGDALELAAQVAAMYKADARMRRLVQTVVPVAGLLGQAGSILTQREFVALETLASEPASILSSADTFAGAASQVPHEDRRQLLSGLGLFGVRLCIGLVQQGLAADSGALARELRHRSGLDELRGLLLDLFTRRADSLKAQVGLQQLDTVLVRHPRNGADELRRQMEATVVGAHELTELRLLNDLRSGEIEIDDRDLLEAAEALLGSNGTALRKRLQLPDETDPDQLRPAVMDALRTWQRIDASPVSDPGAQRAASVLRRTCEGILASLRQRGT